MAVKIRTGDQVIIITGKDKGKCGKVKKVLSSNKVIVEGINLFKHHEKAIPTLNRTGGIRLKESAIHISNVAIYNVKNGKADRIGFKLKQGKKIRFFKSTNQIITNTE
ncbi:MAG: 50S ribosomal protein L24 [Candidatus Dasytiphilus stammeri]